jgi:hypothetical protein
MANGYCARRAFGDGPPVTGMGRNGARQFIYCRRKVGVCPISKDTGSRYYRIVDQLANPTAARGLEKCRQSAAALTQSREKLLMMRAVMIPGTSREQLDRMITLNGETLATLRRTIVIFERDLALDSSRPKPTKTTAIVFVQRRSG